MSPNQGEGLGTMSWPNLSTTMELKFKSLPFTPEQGEVIYIESEYNEKLNSLCHQPASYR